VIGIMIIPERGILNMGYNVATGEEVATLVFGLSVDDVGERGFQCGDCTVNIGQFIQPEQA